MYTLIESDSTNGVITYKTPCGEVVPVAQIFWGNNVGDTYINLIAASGICANTFVQVTKLIENHFEE